MKILENAPDDGKHLAIFSDSLSVLAAVEGGNSKHPWVQHIEQLLNERDAILIWIPGHCGIPGNDQADEAAKAAREIIDVLVPKQDVLRWAQEKIKAAWDKESNSRRSQAKIGRIRKNRER